MKSQAMFWMVLSIVVLFSCMLLPAAEADTFDIGEQVSVSDVDRGGYQLVCFDSESVVHINDPDYTEYIPSIFDGDESTGINHNFGPGHSEMRIDVIFPSALNVSNITVNPEIGGGTTNYSLEIIFLGLNPLRFEEDISIQQTYNINCEIKGIRLELDNSGTNHFYFQDVIIRYTPDPLLPEAIQAQIDDLEDQINNTEIQMTDLQNQIDSQQAQILQLENENSDLRGDINELKEDDGYLELYLEPPFLGIILIILVVLILLVSRRASSMIKGMRLENELLKKKQSMLEEVERSLKKELDIFDTRLSAAESDIEDLTAEPEPEESEGRFCPNCKKYTKEPGPFCPHCKKSMV